MNINKRTVHKKKLKPIIKKNKLGILHFIIYASNNFIYLNHNTNT